MTWTMLSSVRSNVRKIAVAGVLIGVPTAAVSVPAYAAPGFGAVPNTPAVLPAAPPADPPPPPPPPPTAQQPNGEYYNPNDPDDWWPYAGTGSF